MLRKENFPPFIETTKDVGYEVDSITLGGFTSEEYHLIKSMITGGYSQTFETKYGFPFPFDASAFVEVRYVLNFHLPASHADVKKLEIAHGRKLIDKFTLKKYVRRLTSSECPDPALTPGNILEGMSLAGVSLANKAKWSHLFDKSKPQDYMVTVNDFKVPLQAEVRKLFEEIPQIAPLSA